ncbi:LacI family DNA-binding transcriptional regulator [Staphylococcus ratti]|uniref:LacI family DNA-binding transcriptional regulator n=1 Tax=Staphylococcus ratti TaxID=2892440 RepID=A0ABY3PAC7_9STAP|nr:LacI family DNA-binding transcriptional regulator [Staphylococcus ratti]UEX89244.1 LacI family DNA-binding transcriptional regulator [Staphylococcus ratti]
MNISDIAKMAKVSKSTVSRYLNGGSVSQKTKDKIDKIVQATGYSPNQFAQSLKAKRTFMIGAIIPRLDSYATHQILEGAEHYFQDNKYQILIVNTNQSIEQEIEALYTLNKNKVDGILLVATQITEKHIEAIQDIKAPVLLIGQANKHVPSVIQNDFEAGRSVGEVIGQQHFKRIAYLGVGEYDKAVGVDRKKGVLTGLNHYHQTADVYYTTFDLQQATLAASALVSHYDVIICGTDNIALGTLKAAHQQHLQVPKQLSIVGFGGYDTTTIVTPSLATMRFPYKQTGEQAAQNLIRIINGETVERLKVMTFEFIKNASIDFSQSDE